MSAKTKPSPKTLRTLIALSSAVLFYTAPAARATTAADLCAVTADPCVVNGTVLVTDGSIIDVGDRELRVANSGALDVGSGNMTLLAGTLTVEPQGRLLARGNASSRGGVIEAQAGTILVQGTLDAVGAPGGRVELTADDTLTMSGSVAAGAQPGAATESGGDVEFTAHTINVSGPIRAPGGSSAEEGPLGGTITLQASGDVTISNVLDVTGAEGGFLEIFAGSTLPGVVGPTPAGSVTIAQAGQLVADSNTASGSAGDIEIDAGGDGVTTGHIFINGPISGVGRTGSSETGGGEGAALDLTAIGDITSGDGGTIDVRGGGPDGCGGMVDVTTARGSMDLAADITIRSSGIDSEAGAFTADVNGDVNIRGKIDGTAGAGGGGEVSIDSFEGAVSLLDEIDLTSTSTGSGTGGSGGTLSVGTFDEPIAVVVRGALQANGTGNGTGGSIELVGKESVQINARVAADGGNQGGHGGTVCLTAEEGAIVVDGRVSASASGANSTGGIVTTFAQDGITVSQEIDVRGQGGSARFCRALGTSCQNDDDCFGQDTCVTAGGGSVDFSSTGPVDVLANVLAGSTGGRGGRVEIVSEDDVTLSGSMTTDGSREPGGSVDALGCSVIVCGLNASVCPPGGVGVISSLGQGGGNRLRGRGRVGSQEAVVTVLGTMRADQLGGNALVWSGTPEAFRPAVLGSVTPAQRLEVDGTLLPCPVCGNGVEEPPETCDDGNREDGDGCSSICQIESDVVAGDVNGDRVVNDADLCDLVTEFFDGDGDSVGSVGTRPPRSTPGADANDDRKVNAADVTATIRLRDTPSEACAPCLGRTDLCQ